MNKLKIYIDDDGDYKELADSLKAKIIEYFKDAFQVTIWKDVIREEGTTIEDRTIEAIDSSDIVIPILSPKYLSYLTENIEKKFNSIIDNNSKYLIPIYYKKSSWSSYDWVVKSNVFPNGEKSLNELSEKERESEYSKLFLTLENILNSRIADTQTSQLKNKEKIVPSKEKTIFISHNQDDSDFAELMSLHLEKHGIKTWLDKSKLKIGQEWRTEIDEGIKNCSAVIVIMSPEARKSEYVTYEWSFAWGKGKKVFPVMLKQTSLHPRLESLQYLDFTNKLTRPWSELINSILEIK